MTSLKEIQAAADFIRSQTQHQPTVAMILGSGLGPLADDIEDEQPACSVDMLHDLLGRQLRRR